MTTNNCHPDHCRTAQKVPPLVIPVFISHQGCPHRCIFCDQHRISGQAASVANPQNTPQEITRTIETWLARPRRNPTAEVQVAFYGGSFTGQNQAQQTEQLGAVQPFLKKGLVGSIRLSTRPDYINKATVSLLKRYGVETVELGIQSMDETVLKASGRGHTAVQVINAASCLKKAGLTFGAQLMVGLPAETTGGLLRSAARLAALRPDFIRIYPTLVIRGSGLAHLFTTGTYQPFSLNKAVARTARLRKLFDAEGIRVVRMGLQPSASLEESLLAGPYHPAFGELVFSRLLFQEVRRGIARLKTSGPCRVTIHPADQSAFRGQGNQNMKRLAELGVADRVVLELDHNQPRHTISVTAYNSFSS